MVKGRPMFRLAQRVASVVAYHPARWRAPTARFLKVPWPVPGAGADGEIVFAVEGVAEPVQGLDRLVAADEAGDGRGLARVASRLVTPSAECRQPWRGGWSGVRVRARCRQVVSARFATAAGTGPGCPPESAAEIP